MEITDLAGLSQPLTKLIEVVSAGFGAVAKPILTIANTKADAYAIEHIAAVTLKNHELLKINYQSNNICIATDEKQIADRISARLSYQEIKRQVNAENIVQIAAQELNCEETVSTEAVDDNWATRFFNIAQDVSNDEMQSIWGKILAGEIKKPKSYSLRTLELLKNISSDEAVVFSKIAKLAINFNGVSFIINDESYLRTNYSITFSDLLKLEELGLIQKQLAYQFEQVATSTQMTVNKFMHGNFYVTMSRLQSSPETNIPVHLFSSIGIQLLLLTQIDGDLSYVEKFKSMLIRDDVQVEYGLYNQKDMSMVQVIYSSKSQVTNV